MVDSGRDQLSIWRIKLKDKLTKEKFVELYIHKNLTIQEIATRFNITVPSVTRLKKEYKIETKLADAYRDKRAKKVGKAMRESARRRKYGKISDTLSKEMLEYLYCDCKLSLEDIGKRFGCSRMYIMKLCKLYNILLRSKSHARIEASKKGKIVQPYYEINEKFFKEWSSASAWVLGLLFTDGCVSLYGSGNYEVTLASIDYSLLLKVKNLMKSTHPIIRPNKNQPNLYMFRFARDEIINDLIKLGMVQHKSLILKFPQIPQQFLRHFIRGCWDGDGTVFLEKGANKGLRTSYTSGSKEFIYTMEQLLQTEAGLSKQKIYRRGKSFYFKYGHTDSVKLFHYFYGNVSPDMYLERKYKKFLEGMKTNRSMHLFKNYS
ncbi:MAG: LAGLIDADG family homing endonuclease [bacterium]|nr:LAGLIDADG family homing endonuclease [bacterium]